MVWLAAPDGRLHLTLLDVGGSDGLLLQTPGGRTILIDGGSNPSLRSESLGRRLPLPRRQLDWLAVGERSAVLLLAEGGLASFNPPEWIGVLRPQVVVLSAGTDDPRIRPNPKTLQAVQGYTLLRTDRNGWIELTTDGVQIWVEVERE